MMRRISLTDSTSCVVGRMISDKNHTNKSESYEIFKKQTIKIPLWRKSPRKATIASYFHHWDYFLSLRIISGSIFPLAEDSTRSKRN